MRRHLSTVLLLAAAALTALVGCKAEVPVPGKERIGTFQLISQGLPLTNDCSELLVPDGGVPIDAGVILSVTYNNTTSLDGGHLLPDGGPITPYDAGYLTQVDGSGTEEGVIVGQVLDVSGESPRVFSSCNCPSIDPADILVHEENILAVLSASQAARVALPDGGCPPFDTLLDAGIPGGPDILPPRSAEGLWDVRLVCGVNLIQIKVRGPTCDVGCVSCSLSNLLHGTPGGQ
jgi:hypothetical protein